MDFSTVTAELSLLAFAGLLVAAAASDWRSLTVPNRYSLAIAALFVPYALVAGGDVDWLAHLGVASAVRGACCRNRRRCDIASSGFPSRSSRNARP